MMTVNELKSGNMLTKALAKGQARGMPKANAPRENPMQSSTKPQIASKHRHGEYR